MTHLGVVCVHGLGGTPHSVMPLTTAVHAAGYAVVAPHLPGHGTQPTDLAECTWDDWMRAVIDTVDELSRRCSDGIVIVGQSMGATLGLLASLERSSVRGVAAINPLVLAPDPDTTEHLLYLLGRGRTMQPAGDPDLLDPAAHDTAYAEMPLHSLIELGRGSTLANAALPTFDRPVLVVSSDHDSVVDPANADTLADTMTSAGHGPASRLHLPHSGHVAALDLDRELLCRELLTWLANLTDSSAAAG